MRSDANAQVALSFEASDVYSALTGRNSACRWRHRRLFTDIEAARFPSDNGLAQIVIGVMVRVAATPGSFDGIVRCDIHRQRRVAR